ncbi:hypothetical protein M758_1G063700, partial [Ceratodon purpureus]
MNAKSHIQIRHVEHKVYNPLRRQPETRIPTWKNTPRSSSSTQDSKYSSNILRAGYPILNNLEVDIPALLVVLKMGANRHTRPPFLTSKPPPIIDDETHTQF